MLSDIGHPCTAFGSTWAHSRSSNSVSAAMKDYVAPEAFQVRTCKSSPDLSSSASGSVNRRAHPRHRKRRHRLLTRSLSLSDTAHLAGGDDPTGMITFKLYGPGDADCSGPVLFTSSATVFGNASYQSGSFAPTAAGTYRWVVEYSGDDNNRGAGPTACGDHRRRSPSTGPARA